MRARSTATSGQRGSSSPARPERSPAPLAPPHRITVEIVFVTVRGRARLHVEGLRGKPDYAGRLQARLAVARGVRQAQASVVTGNVLVLFDPAALDLRSLISAVARHAGEVRNGGPRAAPRADSAWHTMTADAVSERLRTNPIAGLGADDAARRLAEAGENSLPTPAPKSSLEILADHLTSLPVLATRVHDLSIAGREPRAALEVDLRCGDRCVRVVVTHLGLRAGERRRQVARLLAFVRDENVDATLLLGDMERPYSQDWLNGMS